MSEKRHIKIFDTTLRDGEQSPGLQHEPGREAGGRPGAGRPGRRRHRGRLSDRLAGRLRSGPRNRPERSAAPTICGLARCNETDIDRAWEALKHAEAPRIHVFLATSAIHREFKLKMDKEEIIERAVARREAGRRAIATTSSSRPRTPPAPSPIFSARWSKRRSTPGPRRSTFPTRSATPRRRTCGSVIRTLDERVPNIDKAVISVHCHNDLGLAVANSLAGSRSRRRPDRMHDQRHRRAGRQLLARRSRDGPAHAQRLLPGVDTRSTRRGWCRPAGWSPTSPACRCSGTRRSSAATPSPTRPAFIRTACSRSARPTRSCGPRTSALRKTDLVLGKHSGRAALADRAKALGYHLTASSCRRCSTTFKKLADKKKEIYDGDIAALIEQQIARRCRSLVDGRTTRSRPACGQRADRDAHASPRRAKSHSETMTAGDGPVDAMFLAIEKITGITTVCRDFRVQSVTVGKDAQAEVNVEVEYHGKCYRGRGVSTDSVEASA